MTYRRRGRRPPPPVVGGSGKFLPPGYEPPPPPPPPTTEKLLESKAYLERQVASYEQTIADERSRRPSYATGESQGEYRAKEQLRKLRPSLEYVTGELARRAEKENAILLDVDGQPG
jgi:hypothetical protein